MPQGQEKILAKELTIMIMRVCTENNFWISAIQCAHFNVHNKTYPQHI